MSSEKSKIASELHPTYDGLMISPGGARRTRGQLFTRVRKKLSEKGYEHCSDRGFGRCTEAKME